MKAYPWRTVTGADFARSIRWARTQAPTLRELIEAAAQRIAESKNPNRKP